MIDLLTFECNLYLISDDNESAFQSRSILQVEVLQDFNPVVFLSALVVSLEQILDSAPLHLRHLLLQLVLELLQDLALTEPLAYATNAAHVLGVLLGSYYVQLVLLLTLTVKVLLVLESLQDVLETYLGRRRRLRPRGLASEGLHLAQVLVQLLTRLVDVGSVGGGLPPEFLLQFADQVHQS
jgi:hypothetical protein